MERDGPGLNPHYHRERYVEHRVYSGAGEARLGGAVELG